MKIVAKLAAAAAFAMAGALGAQAQAITEIRIGTEGAYPPYNNLNAQRQLEGFEIDLVNDLCDRIMKVKCTWVVQDWDGIIPALLANKYDVIVAGMNATPERQRRVAFTDVYTSSPIAVVTTKANTSNDFSPAATRGKAWGRAGLDDPHQLAREALSQLDHPTLPDPGRGQPRPAQRPRRLPRRRPGGARHLHQGPRRRMLPHHRQHPARPRSAWAGRGHGAAPRGLRRAAGDAQRRHRAGQGGRFARPPCAEVARQGRHHAVTA